MYLKGLFIDRLQSFVFHSAQPTQHTLTYIKILWFIHIDYHVLIICFIVRLFLIFLCFDCPSSGLPPFLESPEFASGAEGTTFRNVAPPPESFTHAGFSWNINNLIKSWINDLQDQIEHIILKLKVIGLFPSFFQKILVTPSLHKSSQIIRKYCRIKCVNDIKLQFCKTLSLFYR